MKLLRPLMALCFALGVWQAMVWITTPPRYILPAPWDVAQAWWHSRGLIWQHSLITGLEVGLGLLIGGLLGVLTALGLAVSPRARLLVQPVLVFTQALPVFALAPLLVLWFGFGIASKVVMAVLIIYFPVASAFLDGLLRTPPAYLDLARSMGARAGARLWRVQVPAALPALASGLRLAAVYAPIGAVIGEWVGASGGLGYLMLLANGRAKTDLMFAALLTLGVMSVLLYVLVRRATEGWAARYGPTG